MIHASIAVPRSAMIADSPGMTVKARASTGTTMTSKARAVKAREMTVSRMNENQAEIYSFTEYIIVLGGSKICPSTEYEVPMIKRSPERKIRLWLLRQPHPLLETFTSPQKLRPFHAPTASHAERCT